jgi:hypothetical protein
MIYGLQGGSAHTVLNVLEGREVSCGAARGEGSRPRAATSGRPGLSAADIVFIVAPIALFGGGRLHEARRAVVRRVGSPSVRGFGPRGLGRNLL